MNLAIIPARGGSKRIPRKNIKVFCGKPMIQYALSAAEKSGLFDAIVVSTDDESIADLASKIGASSIVQRPPELADDYVGTFPVVQHALKKVLEDGRSDFEFVCCIYATTPFLQAADLQLGLSQLRGSPTACYAFSVTSFAFPVQRALRLSGQGVAPVEPEQIKKRSQDLEPYYHDAGQFYWGKRSAWEQGDAIFKPHSIPIILPRHRVQDIDTPEDWAYAEFMFEAQRAANSAVNS